MRQVGKLKRAWAREKEGLDDAGQWRWELAGLDSVKSKKLCMCHPIFLRAVSKGPCH